MTLMLSVIKNSKLTKIISVITAVAILAVTMIIIVPLFTAGAVNVSPVEYRFGNADVATDADHHLWAVDNLLTPGSWFNANGVSTCNLSFRPLKNVAITKIVLTANDAGGSNDYPAKLTFGEGSTWDAAKASPLAFGVGGGTGVITGANTTSLEAGNKRTYRFDKPVVAAFLNILMEEFGNQVQFQGVEIYGYDLPAAKNKITGVTAKSDHWGIVGSITDIVSDAGGGWADTIGDAYNAALVFDFGTVKELASVRLTPWSNFAYVPIDFNVYTSADGSSFTLAKTFTNFTPVQPVDKGTLLDLTDIESRYLKIDFPKTIDGTTGNVALAKIEFYGDSAVTPISRRLTNSEVECIAVADTNANVNQFNNLATILNPDSWYNANGDTPFVLDFTFHAKQPLVITSIKLKASAADGIASYPTQITFGGADNLTAARTATLAVGPTGYATGVVANANSAPIADSYRTYDFPVNIGYEYVNMRMQSGKSATNRDQIELYQIEIYGYDANVPAVTKMTGVSVKSKHWGSDGSITNLLSDAGSGWGDAVGDVYNAALQFDFGTAQDIANVVFTPYSNFANAPVTFNVYTSTDGAAYELFQSYKDFRPIQPDTMGTSLAFTGLNTRYLMIDFPKTVNGATGTVNLFKIAFYNGVAGVVDVPHTPTERALTAADFGLFSTTVTGPEWNVNNLLSTGWWMSAWNNLDEDVTIHALKNIAITKIVMTMSDARDKFPQTIDFGYGYTLDGSKGYAVDRGPSSGPATVTNDLNPATHPSLDYTYTFDQPVLMPYLNMHFVGGKGGGDGCYQLTGMKVYGYEVATPPGTLVSPTAVTASATAGAFTADNLISGGSMWSSGVVTGDKAELMVDMGSPTPMSGLRIIGRGDYVNFSNDYALSTSDDGVTYTRLPDTYVGNKQTQPAGNGTDIQFVGTVTTRYLKIEVSTPSGGNSTIDLVKLQMYKVQPETSAFTKIPVADITMTGNSLDASYPVSNLNNDNKGDMWSSPATTEDVVITVTFNKLYAINDILLFGRGDSVAYPKNISFKYSADGVNYSNLSALAGNGSYLNLATPLPGYPVAARFVNPLAVKYLQIIVSGGTDTVNMVNQLSEIEFYGSAVPVATGSKIAVTKCVALPSTMESLNGDNLIDGSIDNLWDAGALSVGSEPTVTFTLPNRYNVTSIKLFGRGDFVCMPKKFKVQSSSNGSRFTDIPGAVYDIVQYQPHTEPGVYNIPVTTAALEAADTYYIRIVILELPANNTPQFTEVEIYGTPSNTPPPSDNPDVVIKSITSTATDNAYPLSNLFDGDKNTLWAAQSTANPVLNLQFNGYYNLSQITFLAGPSAVLTPSSYGIQYSTDGGKTWQNLGVTANTSTPGAIIFSMTDSPVRAAMLRITINDASAKAWQIGELMIKGTVDSNQRQPNNASDIIGDINDANIYD